MNQSVFSKTIMEQKYSHTLDDGSKETWDNIAYRVTKHVMRALGITMRDTLAQNIKKAISERKFMPGGRYLYASGRQYHQVNNCALYRASDSREGWAKLVHNTAMSLMSGAGIGIDYSGVREEGALIRKTGGLATGPLALMQIVNEQGRFIMQGGARRSAIWAGLKWNHPDIHKFIRVKNWIDVVRKQKEVDFNFPATLDGTNISVLLDDDFFAAYDKHDSLANSVYWAVIEQMLSTAEPGFSIDTGKNRNETLRNACTEIVTEDDSDICNLGSINLARVDTLEEFRQLVELGITFLLAGTIYSDVPHPEIDAIRTKNRRLGLGLMGVHEWLLKRGRKYGPDRELGEWLKIYADSTDVSHRIAKQHKLTPPVKTRAIAPTGTIGIVAETTTGIEPVFCVAFKRRYLKHQTWHYQYVIDPTAKRLIDAGVKPESIEDAYSIDTETRVGFQAWAQQYVDHAISSTINLPAWGSEANNSSTIKQFGDMLIKYLPNLRGITCYPDGCRGGQPLTPVKYLTAMKHVGVELVEESMDVCELTKGGTCGA